MKNRGMLIAVCIVFISFILDLISTLINWKYVPYLETNKLFHYAGLPGVIFSNIFIIVFCYYMYVTCGSSSWRFFYLYLLVLIIMIRIPAIIGNFQLYHTAPPMDVVINVPESVKQEYFVRTVSSGLSPYLIAILSFLLYRKDHIIQCKE